MFGNDDAVPDPTAETRARVKAPPPDEVDVAIIGAGLGGLVSGALLAQKGMSVAIFDGHYVAGGCCTMFQRGPADARYRFDVGLHYIGDCGPEGRITKILRSLDIDLDFVPLDPDGFDTIVLPNLRFRIPADRELYRERLVEAFPRERKGIDRYVRFLREVQTMGGAMDRGAGPMRVALDAVLHGRLVARYQNATIGAVLDTCTTEPDLRAIILGQHGDYGLPPSKVSALLHAGLANHYFGGAYYPRGGGQAIADALAEKIEALGGQVLLRRPIDRVLVEGGRAVGVRVAARRQDPHDVRAKVVISNADLKKTLDTLLPREAVSPEWEARSARFEMGGAIFITFLGVKMDLAARGFGRTNYWMSDTPDVEALYRDVSEGRWRPGMAYITSGSLKDPGTAGHAPEGITSVEAMTLVPSDPSFWGISEADIPSGRYRDNPAYLARKAEIERGMVSRLDDLFPGAGDAVVFCEGATPATQTRYTGATGGTGYGLAATPAQFLKNRPGYRGPVEGLYLAGASTRAGHGVVGAMMSGVQAAKRVTRDLSVPFEPPYP